MSDEHVEFVRRCFGVVARAFDAYWREPRSIARVMEANDLWPEWRELFELLDPARVLRVDEHTTRAQALAALEHLRG